MRLTYLTLAAFLFGVAAEKVIGQTARTLNPPHSTYGLQDGLPALFVTHLFCDSYGRLWVSTNHGVAYFDGRSFVQIESAPLLNDFVLAVGQDTEDTIYCQTIEGRIYRLTKGKWESLKYNQALEKVCGKNCAPSGRIDFDSKNHLVTDLGAEIAIFKGGQIVILETSDTLHKGKFIQAGRQLFGNYDPNITASTIEMKLDNTNFNIDCTVSHESIDKKVFTALGRNQAAFSKLRNITLVTGDTCMQIESPSEVSNSLMFDQLGRFWFGTAESGAFMYENQVLSARIFRDFNVTAIAQDFEGGYWFGTLNGGLKYVSSIEVNKIEIPMVESHGILRSVKDEVIGMTESGQIFDLKGRIYSAPWKNVEGRYLDIHPSQNLIISTYRTDNLNWFLATADLEEKEMRITPTFGLSKHMILKGEDTILTRTSRITSIGRGRSQGVARLRNVTASHHVADDLFLFATQSGLQLVDLSLLAEDSIEIKTSWCDSIKFTHLVNLENKVLCIAPNKPFYTYHKASGVVEEIENSPIISTTAFHRYSKSVCYLGTTAGLWKMEAIGDGWEWTNISSDLGLSRSTIFSITHRGDSLYTSESEGYMMYPLEYQSADPDGFGRVSFISKRFKDQEMAVGRDDFSPFQEDLVSFKVSSVSFKKRNFFSYQYRLLPNDTSWTTSTQDEITFYQMAAGDYELQLKNGSKITTAAFTINQHYYQTTWFLVLCIVVLVLGGSLPFYYRQRVLAINLKLEQERDQLKLRSLTSQLKPHFVFNALSSMQAFILENDPMTSSKYLSKFAKHIRATLDLSTSDLISLEKSLETTENYLQLEQLRMSNSFEYEIDIDQAIRISSTLIPPLLIQPYIENAIVHAMSHRSEGGFIEVKVSLSEKNKLGCTVSDNGPGFSEAPKNQMADTMAPRLIAIE